MARAGEAFSFLELLVAAPSTVGREQEAQEVVEQELKRLGLEVERLPIPAGIGEDPLAGAPQTSYETRGDVIGRLRGDKGPSLLVNGHIDDCHSAESWTFQGVRGQALMVSMEQKFPPTFASNRSISTV